MNISLGALFDVNENRIVVTCIDQFGNTQDNFIIKPKRTALELDKLDFDIDKFSSDIDIKLTDFDNHKGILKCNNSSELKYVKSIKVSSKRNILIENINYTDLADLYELENINTNTLKIKVTLLDNSVIELEKDILPLGDITDLEVELKNNYSFKFNNNIKSYNELDYYYVIDGKRINQLTEDNLEDEFINIDLEYLKKDFIIGLEVFDEDNLIQNYELNVSKKCDEYLILDKDIIDIEFGSKILLIPKLGKVSDKQDEVISIKDGLLEVTGYGESDIIINNDGKDIFYHLITKEEVKESTEVIEPTEVVEPTEPVEPTVPSTETEPVPQPEKKSGCKSSLIINIFSILSVIGFMFIIRKKYY